jgi:DNA repair protein RecO (recombination protein O)
MRLALAMLTAACAVTESALPEREAHPRIFDGLLHLLARLPIGAPLLADQIRWEAVVLADLGYGLDLSACAVTGGTGNLRYVSPKTGRAVTAQGAGEWAARLLPLPPLLLDDSEGTPQQWRDGLRLTGHFLARDVFGLQHKPLPAARIALYDRVQGLVDSDKNA